MTNTLARIAKLEREIAVRDAVTMKLLVLLNNLRPAGIGLSTAAFFNRHEIADLADRSQTEGKLTSLFTTEEPDTIYVSFNE